MDKTLYDQAEGLRRMLAGPRPRIFTFLSATHGEEKSAVLVNLGASLVRTGNSVLVLDACVGARGIAAHLNLPPTETLLHVSRRECELEDIIHDMPQGFGIATLAHSSLRATMRNQVQADRLSAAFDALAEHSDVIVVDTELDAEDTFPLAAMADGEIVIQVSDRASSIKSAYSIIKRINSQHGRRPISVLVTGTSEQRSQVVYANMAKAASRYLAVQLNSIGYVPADEHVTRATHLGRTVIDAFPLAGASVAFRRLAGYFSTSGVPPDSYGMMSKGSNFTA